MSLHVHGMVIDAERKLLPSQAARGWQIEEAAARERHATLSRWHVSLPSVSALGRVGQVLLTVATLLRQISS